jgi:DNA-binding NarL/FixJ family response regulator
VPRLTAREREVLVWLARGSTNRQIGLALEVSPRTVEKHFERILTKLGATNRTIAALLAAGFGGNT